MEERGACICMVGMKRTSREGASCLPRPRSAGVPAQDAFCALATHITVLGLAKGCGGARGWRHRATAALVVVARVEPGGQPHCLCLLALLADARKPERVGRMLKGGTHRVQHGRQARWGRQAAGRTASSPHQSLGERARRRAGAAAAPAGVFLGRQAS